MLSTSRGIKMLRRIIHKKKNLANKLTDTLHAAVKSSDVRTLVRLLLRGDDLNGYDDQGVTPLHVACEAGNSNLAQILISLGADVNFASSGETGSCPALVVAATHGNSECVRILLEGGAASDASDKWGNTALFKAATYNHITCVKLLLHFGATPDVTNSWGATPLQYAVIQDHIDIVHLLLSFGADPNLHGESTYPSPVQSAVSGHYHCLDLLVGAAADVNTNMPSGVKLLTHIVAEGTDISNDLYSAQLLLDNGAEVDSDCITALAKRCQLHLNSNSSFCDSLDGNTTDCVKLGNELYQLFVILVTSLPSCDCSVNQRMHLALSCLYDVLNTHKAFDCVSLIVKLGFIPSTANLPIHIAEELGLLKQTESLMLKSLKVVQKHVKDFSKVNELPLPLCIRNSVKL